MSPNPSLSRRAAVFARSLFATAEIVGLSAVVHTQAGGHRPGLLQTAVVAAAVLAGALALVTRRVGLLTVAVSVLGAQVVLHAGFTLATASTPGAASSGSMPMDMAMPTVTSSAGMLPGWHMVLTHLVVGLVTLLVLACQDLAVRAVKVGLRAAERLGPLLIELRQVRPTRRARRGAHAVLLLAGAPRRGPPARSLLTP